MKTIKVKDLTSDNVIYNATKFFTNGNEKLGFVVVNAIYHACGFVDAINKYRRAYAVEQALENSDQEVSFLQDVLKDAYNDAISFVLDKIDRINENLTWNERATIEEFLKNLNYDAYDETGSRQTLID